MQRAWPPRWRLGSGGDAALCDALSCGLATRLCPFFPSFVPPRPSGSRTQPRTPSVAAASPQALRERGAEARPAGLAQGLRVSSPLSAGGSQTSPDSLRHGGAREVLLCPPPARVRRPRPGPAGVHGSGLRCPLSSDRSLPPLWSRPDLPGTWAFGGGEGQSRELHVWVVPTTARFHGGSPGAPGPLTSPRALPSQPVCPPLWAVGGKGLSQRTGWRPWPVGTWPQPSASSSRPGTGLRDRAPPSGRCRPQWDRA